VSIVTGGTERVQVDSDGQLVVSAGTAALPGITASGDTDTGVSFPAANTLAISTGGSERARITSAGDLGLGTISPAFASGSGLHVERAGVATVRCYNSSSTAAVEFRADASGVAIDARGLEVIRLLTGGGERARIDSSGSLNIGNANALNGNAKLSIWNTAGSNYGFATGYGSGTSQFRLIYLTSAANNLNFDNGSNNATLSASGVWTNASDANLKKNIVDIKYGLSTINDSKPRSFNRVDVDGDYIGFVAQELEEIIPEVVYPGDKNLTVDYGSLVAVAFKAIQELSAKNDALEARIAALEAN
jgi:hypothetical protein